MALLSEAGRTFALRARGLSKRYGRKYALEKVDLAVETGERFCVVGQNGSGKSTLLELVMALKTPSEGELEVLGHPPTSPALLEKRSILMDRPVFPYYCKVREALWLYSGCRRSPRSEELLERFEVDRAAYIRHLSKGQLQRLMLVLSLLHSPSLLLLDEPTSGLDPEARVELWEHLGRDLERRPDRTLVFASHDMEEASRHADRVAVLHQARLVATGSPRALCAQTVGVASKVTVRGAGAGNLLAGNGAIRSFRRLGEELVLYTDDPQEILRRLQLGTDELAIRVGKVSLEDAFFHLIGEVDEPRALAS